MASMEQQERIDPMEESFHEDAKLCPVCGKNFMTVSGLRRHKMKHEEKYIHNCEHCGKKLMKKEQLLGHVRSQHRHEEKLTCDRCHRTFGFKFPFKRHVASCKGMKDTKYECKRCNLQFHRKDSLADHISGVHENIRKFRCAVCSLSFKWRSSLYNHNKAKHVKDQKN